MYKERKQQMEKLTRLKHVSNMYIEYAYTVEDYIKDMTACN